MMLAETLQKSLVSVLSKLSVRTKINQLQLVAFVGFPGNRLILFLFISSFSCKYFNIITYGF